jgi:outer membrane protein assembly factor BamE
MAPLLSQPPPGSVLASVPMRRTAALPLIAAAALLLGGCDALQRTDSWVGGMAPYRIDIVQGNVITREQAALIRPGMSRLQVRDILGTPLIADPFHANRWDYLFTMRRAGTDVQRRSVVVLFEGDAVKSIEAPELPSERDFVAAIGRPVTGTAPRLELSEAERAALPTPARREAPPTEPVGPVREYPPLERP